MRLLEITEHLNKFVLISNSQHGYVRSRGFLKNLLMTVDVITFAFAKGLNVDVILLNFAKAFDKVPHRRLIIKLNAYGKSGNLLKWIECFLTGRRQRVVLGQFESNWCKVTSGVPLGSVLCPLLFIIFINDMMENLLSKILLYAADSKLISRIDGTDCNSNILTQEELQTLVNWSNELLMEFFNFIILRSVEKFVELHLYRCNT